MEAGNQVLLLLLVITIVGTIIYQMVRSRVVEPNRSEAVGQAIAQAGWQLEPQAPLSLTQKYERFPFFKNSKGKEIRNVITGQVDGINFVSFDYRYFKLIRGAYRRTSQMETVVITENPNLDLPTFALVQPRTLEPSISEFQSFGNVGLYRLEGVDEQAVKSLITEALIAGAPEFNIQGMGKELVFYRTWQRSKPVALVREIHQCSRFAKLLGGESISHNAVSHRADQPFVV